MKINQKRIAEKVGVSQTTVSFVLNNKDMKISPQVRKKIIETAEELGYRKFFPPEEDFRTGNIGYVFPSKMLLTNPYYHRFYEGVMDGLKGRNLNLVIKSCEKPDDSIERFEMTKNVDGLIIEQVLQETIIEEIKEKIPVVLLNTRTEHTNVDCVMPDNKGGIIKAIEYLYKKGHRKIALFGIKPVGIHQKERLEGYMEGLKIFGLEMNNEYICVPERKVGDIEELNNYARETLEKWFKLREMPTGVVTFADLYALSLIGEADKLGIKVPDDISVIGFDNIINCMYSNPSLTSIEQPLEEIGKKAVALLIERIKNPGKKVEKVIFDVELVERGSVKEAM